MLFLEFKPGMELTKLWLKKLDDQTLKQVDS